MSVTDIFTRLIMDASDFTKGVNEAQEKIEKFAKTSTSAISTMNFAMGTIAAHAIEQMGDKILGAIDHVNELYETSRKIGTTADQLQELEYAMESFGVSGEQVIKMIGFMDASIGKARMGVSTFSDAFKLLKLDLDSLAKKGTEEQLIAIANALEKVGDKTIKVALAKQIFGRSAIDLMGAINSGRLEEVINQYKGTGVSDNTAREVHESIEQLNIELARIRKPLYDLAVVSVHLVTKFFDLTGAIGSFIADVALALAHFTQNFTDNSYQHTDKNGNTTSPTNPLNLSTEWGLKGNPAAFANIPQNNSGPSFIPNMLSKAQIEFKSASQKVQESFNKVADSANEASYNLKDLSKISELLKSTEKKSIDDALKDLLGDTLTGKDPAMNLKNLSKPFDSFDKWAKKQEELGNTNNTMSRYLTEKANFGLNQDANKYDYENFQQQFQQVFKDAKKYGLKGHPITGGIGGNQTVQDEIDDLKRSAKGLGIGTGFNTSGIVGAVNDLEKFAKEQKNKDNKVEMFIKLDPGLLADVKSAAGVKITMQNNAAAKSELAAAASSMGK